MTLREIILAIVVVALLIGVIIFAAYDPGKKTGFSNKSDSPPPQEAK